MENKSTKKRVNELEAKYAKKYGCTKALASGATIYGKGDYYDDYFMFDLKSTIAEKSITLKITDLEKAYHDGNSFSPAKIGVLHIDISGYECFVLRKGDMQYFRQLVEDEEKRNG